jgi:hypothetical protein
MLFSLRERLPARRDLLSVFATAAFIVYTWTMCVSFWKLPSWLFFLETGEILSIYSYAFLVNFVESVLLLSAALVPCIFLPRVWWRDIFVARGAILVVAILGTVQLNLSRYPTLDLRDLFIESQLVWWFHALWLTVLITWMAGRVERLKKGLENVADQLSVFLYVYIPLTVVGLIIVIVRNLW